MIPRPFSRLARRPGAAVRRPSARPTDRAAAVEQLEIRRLLTTYTVTTEGESVTGDGEVSFREALQFAEDDPGADVINFAADVFTVTLTSGLSDYDGDLTIAGLGEVIDLNGNFGAGFSDRLTISNLTFVNGGDFDRGGALQLDDGAVATFTNVSFVGNRTVGDDGDAFEDGDGGGAVVVQDGASLTMTGGAFVRNVAAGDRAAGGAVLVRGAGSSATFAGVTFNENASAGDGGAVAAVDGGAVVMTDALAFRNAAAADGDGGVLAARDGATAEVVGGNFALNEAENGGAFAVADADLTLTGAVVSSNSADLGGAVAVLDTGEPGAAMLTIANAVLLRNDATDGAAIGTRAEDGGDVRVAVADSTLTQNAADRGGAVFLVDGAEANFTESRFIKNTATADGGAVYVLGGDFTASGKRFAQNRAGESGGAVFVADAGSLTLSDMSVNRNVASGDDRGQGGGAVFAGDPENDFTGADPTVTLTDLFMARNEADGDEGGGGGLFLIVADTELTGVNIAGSVATRSGGGIQMQGGNLAMTDTFLRGGRAVNGAGLWVVEDEVFGLNAEVAATGGGLIGNDAENRGGGFFIATGITSANRLITTDLRVRGNTARQGGGGYLDGSRVELTDAVVRNNRADRGGAFGNDGALFLTDALVVGNRADDAAIYTFRDGRTFLEDVNFRRNDPTDLDGPGDIRD